MRKLEKEEEELAYEDPDGKVFHLCIVNLVIGTLYCAKGNFQFGISRVIKSLEPYDKRLGWETWSYTKRCFLALIEGMVRGVATSTGRAWMRAHTQRRAHAEAGARRGGRTQMQAHAEADARRCGRTQRRTHADAGARRCGRTQRRAQMRAHAEALGLMLSAPSNTCRWPSALQAKQMITLPDAVVIDIQEFLDACEGASLC